MAYQKPEDWKKAFDASDTDGSGFIEKDELSGVFDKLNVKLDEKSTKNVLSKFDKDKDGRINEAEFKNMVTFLVEQKTKVQSPQALQTPQASIPTPAQLAESLQKKTVKAPPKKIATPSIISRFGKITGALKEKTHQTVQRVDGLYVDSSFPADDSVLTKQHRGKGIVWKRPGEIIDSPKMFIAGTEEGDVKQGHIGNCWFVGALAVVAASGSDLVEDLFVRYSLAEGRHHIRFYKDFDWVVVEVDDLLPCLPDGRLLYAKCPDPHEFWVPLVEKAYAKLHGGYDQIESGTITDALRDLTGEGVEVIDLRNTENKDELWPILMHNTAESFLMGCAIESTGPAERMTNEGLLTNHAYSILDTREFKDHRLIRVRNPWGQGEWKGAWSDGSKEWNIAGAKAALDYVDENDGTFYMSFKDFSARFNVIHVLRLLLDEVGEVWQKTVFKGKWQGKSAGGCTDHPTWPQNPQYSVTSGQSNNKVFVCLSQPDQRYATDSNKISYEPIGAVVVTGNDDKFKKKTLKRDEVVLRPHYAPRRDLSFEFTANPGKSYIIIPTAFKPGVEIPFELAIYTQKSAVTIEREGEMPKKKVKGAWTGQSAGGCPNFPSWSHNPQFIISSDKTVKVNIALKQKSKTKKDVEPLGLFVFPSPAGQRVVNYSTNPPVFNSPSFTPTVVIQGETTLEAGKTYIVLPCTFEAKKEKRFSLTVNSPDANILSGISFRAI